MIQDNHSFKRFRDCSLGLLIIGVLCVLAFFSTGRAFADGWPTYRFDNARGGVSSEEVQPPLSLSWVYESLHPPKPAWHPPAEEMPRMHKDNAFHATIGGGMVFFGSSVDDRVFAVDKKKGGVIEREGAFIDFTPGWPPARIDSAHPIESGSGLR